MIARLHAYLTGRTGKSAPNPLPDESSTAALDGFLAWVRTLPASATLAEIGTRQWVEGSETHMHGFFPHIPRANYVMIDIEEGRDVDVVADLHRLPADWTGRFDALIASAVFEHLERPWIAAKEVARVLKPGGRCYIGTHQTYPLHAYPSDFFRFSKEALALIFTDAGIEVLEAGYQHRAEIITEPDAIPEAWLRQWNENHPSYLCVTVLGEKPGAADRGA